MDVGLITPVVTANVRFPPAEWERGAGPEELAAVAQAAERLGCRFVTCSEHVAVPDGLKEHRGSRYWDPVATLSYLAACTDRIGLLAYVVVLGYHHPLTILKRWGTVDRLSRGRVLLGVGVGSLEEEFDLLGAEFRGRGDRADDSLRAIRAGMTERVPSYRGPHFAYEGYVVDPVPGAMPLWVGGRTLRSLQRACEHGDAWAPFALEPDEVSGLLGRAAETSWWEERRRPFEIVPAAGAPLDPARDRDGTLRRLAAWRDLGATCLAVRLKQNSPQRHEDQLARLVDLVHRG